MKNLGDDGWDLRVGFPAAASLRKANRFLNLCPAGVAVALIGVFVTKQTGGAALPLLWASILVGSLFGFVISPIGYYYWEVRGGREAAEHISLSDYSRRARVPMTALRSTREFDNFMLEDGIPPLPGYEPAPAPRAYALAEKMRQKRERARQGKHSR